MAQFYLSCVHLCTPGSLAIRIIIDVLCWISGCACVNIKDYLYWKHKVLSPYPITINLYAVYTLNDLRSNKFCNTDCLSWINAHCTCWYNNYDTFFVHNIQVTVPVALLEYRAFTHLMEGREGERERDSD